MALAGTAICRLCRRTFYGPGAVTLGTDQANPALAQFLMKLGEHMHRAHGKEDQALQTKTYELIGYFRLMNFSISDPELFRQLDFLRWTFHRQTMANIIPEDKLQEQSAALSKRLADVFYGLLTMTFDQRGETTPEYLQLLKPAVEAELFRELRPILTGIRDVYEEPGKYTVSPVLAPVPGSKVGS